MNDLKGKNLRFWACVECEPPRENREDYDDACMETADEKPAICVKPDCNVSNTEPKWVEVELTSMRIVMTEVHWKKKSETLPEISTEEAKKLYEHWEVE